MTRAALSIGGNLGDREFYVNAAERELRLILDGVAASGLMETEPVGVDGPQPPYLNKIVVGYYAGGARGLLDACLAIESRLGRTRESPKCPRTADIDILLFGGCQISEPEPPKPLFIPHPEIRNRRFCVEGLMRVDPLLVVPSPGGGLTVRELYEDMDARVAAQNVFFIDDAGHVAGRGGGEAARARDTGRKIDKSGDTARCSRL